jgi:DNA-binding response OmpR family regulator
MRRILIVDEDVDMLSFLKSALKKLHYNVIVTTVAQEVRDILFFFEADLIFVGISRGKEDGKVLCRQLRSGTEYQHIPVVIMSEEDEVLAGYKKIGATGSLRRPFEVSEMVRAAQIYLSN